MQQAINLRVERVARLAAHDIGASWRRQAAAECGAGLDVRLDIGLADQRILDRTIPGAAADIALQRDAEIGALRLVQRGAGQDHAGGAEAALKALRIEESLLHRVRAAVSAETFDRGDGAPLGTEGRDQAAMHRLAVQQHGAGAAIAGVAALLHAEMAELAQERAQALAGAWLLRKRRAVDLEAHDDGAPRSSSRISSASRSVMCLRQSGLPWMSVWYRSSVICCAMASRSAVTSGASRKDNRIGRTVEAVTVSVSVPSASRLPINSAAERPTGASEIWRKTVRRFKAAIGISICRSRSPGARRLRWLPVTKSTTGIICSPPPAFQMVQTPSSAAVSEIIGPAGSDMQRLPPTVAVFQILNEARKARQHWLISGAANQSGGQTNPSSCATVQVAAMLKWLSVTVSAGHFRSARSMSRVRWTCGSENSQVPPASQASPGVQTGSCARVCGWATAVMVFKSMATPTLPTSESSQEKVLQDERQVATTSRSKNATRPAPALHACRQRM